MRVWIIKGFNCYSDNEWIEGIYSNQKSAEEEVISLKVKEKQECEGDRWFVESYEVLD